MDARLPFFALVQRQARRLLNQPDDLLRLARMAEDKARRLESGPLAGLLDQLKALLRLIRAYARGEYRDVSWKSMALVVGAVLYVVSPVDFVPDFIPVSGLLDDASVLGFALRRLHQEIEAFLEWERRTGRAPEPDDGRPGTGP